MAELWFVGAGLGDERDLSRRALDLLKRSTEIFYEEYTGVLAPGAFERLSEELHRPIRKLERAELEGEAPVLEALSRGGTVVFLVPGDPFAATTHIALRRAAEERGHTARYLPNASIVTAAAGLLGLMPYRWGRVTSLPFPEPGFAPRSPVETIERNRGSGLHTLVLLDLRPSEGRFLLAGEALRILAERDPDGKALGAADIAVVARVGTDSARAWYGELTTLAVIDFGPPLHSIVVPAPDLHEEERASLERFRVRLTVPTRRP